jgi:hypothetical protein
MQLAVVASVLDDEVHGFLRSGRAGVTIRRHGGTDAASVSIVARSVT